MRQCILNNCFISFSLNYLNLEFKFLKSSFLSHSFLVLPVYLIKSNLKNKLYFQPSLINAKLKNHKERVKLQLKSSYFFAEQRPRQKSINF